MADAIDAINSLKDKRKFIRGTKGKDLKISVMIKNISNHNQIETLALLDSGATGSCVNKSFVEKHGLTIKKLPIKIPIYNADGSLNNNGSIEGFAEVRMTIGDHSERIELAITNLGSSDIFLGLEWLRLHNPDIDWTSLLLSFNHYPDTCGYRPWWSLPEEGEVLNRLNEGD